MGKRIICAAVVTASCLLVLPTPTSQAAAEAQADPNAYLEAFNDTCRRGFPDLDTIAANAIGQGWLQVNMRVTSAVPDMGWTLPRAYQKNGLMLFLIRPNGGKNQAVCQISSSALTKMTGADFAKFVSSSLNAGVPVTDSSSDEDSAVWTMTPTIKVRAGVSTKRPRTMSISAHYSG